MYFVLAYWSVDLTTNYKLIWGNIKYCLQKKIGKQSVWVAFSENIVNKEIWNMTQMNNQQSQVNPTKMMKEGWEQLIKLTGKCSTKGMTLSSLKTATLKDARTFVASAG